MFKVKVQREPRIAVYMVNENEDVRLTVKHCLKDLTDVFEYQDGMITTDVLGRVEGDGANRYWLVYLGYALTRSEGKKLDINEAMNVARNIRDALFVYRQSSEGSVTEVRFDMSDWDGWDNRGMIVKGDAL
jgi:hypothetical protein